MRTNTPLSGPSWSASNSNVGARTILNDPSAMNPESSARISQVCARAPPTAPAFASPALDPPGSACCSVRSVLTVPGRQVLAMAGTQGLAPSVDPNSTYNYLGNN
jgi:hypothetical protein